MKRLKRWLCRHGLIEHQYRYVTTYGGTAPGPESSHRICGRCTR